MNFVSRIPRAHVLTSLPKHSQYEASSLSASASKLRERTIKPLVGGAGTLTLYKQYTQLVSYITSLSDLPILLSYLHTTFHHLTPILPSFGKKSKKGWPKSPNDARRKPLYQRLQSPANHQEYPITFKTMISQYYLQAYQTILYS